jgi:hypothetical protein
VKVRLLVDISGTRDGVPWPPRGNPVDLPEDEARSMIAAEQAVPWDGPAAKAPPAAERAVMPDTTVEQRGSAKDVKERPLTTDTGPVAPRKGSTR